MMGSLYVLRHWQIAVSIFVFAIQINLAFFGLFLHAFEINFASMLTRVLIIYLYAWLKFYVL